MVPGGGLIQLTRLILFQHARFVRVRLSRCLLSILNFLGLGHTTNSFIQIQGTEDIQPSLMIPLGDSGCFTETNINTIQDVTNALNNKDDNDGKTDLVILNWPRQKCSLLQENVILVDRYARIY